MKTKQIIRDLWFAMLYLWQLPQNLIGLVLIAWYRPERKHILDSGVHVFYSRRMTGGISLGFCSIVNIGHYRKDMQHSLRHATVRHEAIGHARQSRMLGPLYLVVIGLPSIIWASLHWLIAPNCSYYWFYTERWADRLGGVRR